MTNEKAIEILKKLPNICGQGTAVQMAIKAIENIQKHIEFEEKLQDTIIDMSRKLEDIIGFANDIKLDRNVCKKCAGNCSAMYLCARQIGYAFMRINEIKDDE